MIRVDMSEFQEKHSVSRLIGSPPGYVGYNEGGQFTEKVRQRPYSLILFDEIEKGHPDIFNILLQILDDGYVTDAAGRKINFRNTLIMMTSNIGVKKSQDFNRSLGFATKSSEQTDKERIRTIISKSLKNTFICEVGYDEKFGARPLKRAIQSEVEDYISSEILKDSIKEGIQYNLSYSKKSNEFKIVDKG